MRSFSCALGSIAMLLSTAACSTVEVATTGSGGGSSSTGTTISSTTTTTSTGSGTPCGGGTPCGPNDFCDYPDDLCGKGAAGVCTPKPMACDKNLEPTCGCDGSVHDNPCGANLAGVDSNDGGCPPNTIPAGAIPCGAHYCAASTYYCEAAFSDVGGFPSSYTCKPLPAGCNPQTTDCSCFPPSTPCVSQCSIVTGSNMVVGFELDCPGG